MDMSDIIKLIEKFFPILIFLVWILITALANTRKKGPVGKPMPPVERSPYGGHQEQQQTRAKTNEGSQISDDLKRTLETIFGESRPVEKPAPSPEPVPEPMTTENTRIETQVANESSILEEQAALKSAFDEIQNRSVGQVQISAPMKVNEMETEQINLTISQDDLKKGIIWSEILAPPVSMRY